jgi:hypothetical protein
MSSEGGDVLRIPIEIKTDDLDEIQSLINDLDDAENDINVLRPKKGKSTDTTSRSPFERSDDSTGGIFGGQMQEAMPNRGRDKTSNQAFTRENEFQKMRDKVDNVEASQATLEGTLSGMMSSLFGVDLITRGAGSGAVPPPSTIGAMPMGMSAPITSMGTAQNLISGGAGGMITGLVSKLVWPISVALMGIGFVHTVLNELFKAGGLWDRRFKRDFKRESNILTSLEEKAEIRAGRRTIRVTTISGLRGITNQQFSNLDMLKYGTAPYDLNGVASSRGVI